MCSCCRFFRLIMDSSYNGSLLLEHFSSSNHVMSFDSSNSDSVGARMLMDYLSCSCVKYQKVSGVEWKEKANRQMLCNDKRRDRLKTIIIRRCFSLCMIMVPLGASSEQCWCRTISCDSPANCIIFYNTFAFFLEITVRKLKSSLPLPLPDMINSITNVQRTILLRAQFLCYSETTSNVQEVS